MRLFNTFSDKKFEKEYRQLYNESNKRFIRIGIIFSSIGWSSEIFVFYIFYNDHFINSLLLISTILLPLFAFNFYITYNKKLLKLYQFTTALSNILAASLWMYLGYFILKEPVNFSIFLVFVIIYAFFILRLRYEISLILTFSYFTLFIVLIILHPVFSVYTSFVIIAALYTGIFSSGIIAYNIDKTERELFSSNMIINEQNDLLKSNNKKLSQQNEEINSQNEEISAQRDLVMEQKEEIEEIHEHISDSINYATRIQTSILPNESVLKEHLSDHFILFKPKDKVSGDFYWWSQIEGHTVITAADCTGHGVPGAFMSMLGVSFLREIVNREYITHPGVILRKLRKEVINALRQKGSETGSQDGMDMALISINQETNIMQFSGANNSLYLIRRNKLNSSDDKIVKLDLSCNEKSHYFYEIKPDRMPIGIYLKMDKFTSHEVQLQKGDYIYLFSDGYADQFGGPNERKFKYKQFKELLFENVNKSMAEQKNILEEAFRDWKGDIEQIDDIVVLGIKI